MSPTKLFLDQSYVIDGVELTGEEIKEAKIDSIMYRRHLEKSMTEADSQ